MSPSWILVPVLSAAVLMGGAMAQTSPAPALAPVKVDTKAAFSQVRQVVIGGFTIGFDTHKTDSAKAGGGLLGSGFGGKSTAKSELTGIGDEVLQAITDKAYGDFLAQLTAAGYTVVERAQLAEHDKFKTTNTLTMPHVDTQGGMLGGGNTTRYFAPSAFGGIKAFHGDIMGTMGGIGFSSPNAGAAEFAKASGIKVLHVAYRVDFANAEKYGGWYSSSSSVDVKQGLAIAKDLSRMGIIGGWGGTFSTDNGSITLADAITSDKEFAKISDATGEGAKTVETITNVIGMLGGIGTNKSRRYEFKADPAAYADGAHDALRKTSETFVGQMKSLR